MLPFLRDDIIMNLWAVKCDNPHVYFKNME